MRTFVEEVALSKPGSVEIRPFEPRDQRSVVSLATDVLCREFKVKENLDDEEDLQDVASAYAPPDHRFMVALWSGEVVASGGITRLSDHDCELRRLYVLADHRRVGIASSLVAELLSFVRERGYRRILIERRPEMQYSEQEYARFGLKPVTDPESLPREGDFVAVSL